MWQEKVVHISRKSQVNINDSSSHMHEYEVVIEERAIDEQQDYVYKDGDGEPWPPIGISSIIVVIHLKHVSPVELLSNTVNDEDQQKVNGRGNSIPAYHFIEDMREL